MPTISPEKDSLPQGGKVLLSALAARFEKNRRRHEQIEWEQVRKRLEAKPENLRILATMEESGGEPDVVGFPDIVDGYVFVDCSKESPSGRRSLCYDREALEARKTAKPKNSALEMAGEMGIALLTEEQYRFLQGLGEFDLKTSSWLLTPLEVRRRGGAIFADRRYDRVFVYHNGADSYYAARGFRGLLRV